MHSFCDDIPIDPNARDEKGRTALGALADELNGHFALDKKHIEMAEKLIASGADVDAVDAEFEATPLVTALQHLLLNYSQDDQRYSGTNNAQYRQVAMDFCRVLLKHSDLRREAGRWSPRADRPGGMNAIDNSHFFG